MPPQHSPPLRPPLLRAPSALGAARRQAPAHRHRLARWADPFAWDGLKAALIMRKIVVDKSRPDPKAVKLGPLRELMLDCWSDNPRDRPDMGEVLQVFSRPKSSKRRHFSRK